MFREKEKGDIRRFNARIGGGGGGGAEVNSVRGWVPLEHWDERERSSSEVAQSIRAELNKLPGARVFVSEPQGLAIRGFGQPFQAVIGGPDYETLARWSDALLEQAGANPGFLNVDTNYRERKPEIRVSVDRNRAAELGVSLQTVGRTLETVLGSRIVTTYVDRGREYNVILQGRAEDRAQPSDLTNLYVRSSRGGLVPLANLVNLEEVAGAMQLNRFDRLRAITSAPDWRRATPWARR
jgi:multidrug efflux pump